MTTTLAKGMIELEMVNVLPEEIEKLRNYFIQLIDIQIHRFKNGKIILHFDSEGNLMQIEVQKIAWKKKKISTP